MGKIVLGWCSFAIRDECLHWTEYVITSGAAWMLLVKTTNASIYISISKCLPISFSCKWTKLCSHAILTALMTSRQKYGPRLWMNKNDQCPMPTGCYNISILFTCISMHPQQSVGWGENTSTGHHIFLVYLSQGRQEGAIKKFEHYAKWKKPDEGK